MKIVIDTYANEAVRTSDVLGTFKSMVLRQAEKGEAIVCGESADAETIDTILEENCPDGDLTDACAEILIVNDEGSEGVAVGFSSSDRSAFAMPWPSDSDEFQGNADVTVFKTVGVPAGTPVQGETVS